jgi:hypothetical protein
MEPRECLSLSLFPLLLCLVFSVSLLPLTILFPQIPSIAASLRCRLTVGLYYFQGLVAHLFLTLLCCSSCYAVVDKAGF